MFEVFLVFAIVGIVFYLWLERRKEPKRSVPMDPGPTPIPPGGRQPNWDEVWCNAIRSGMPPTSDGALKLMETIRSYRPDWQPPDCT